MSLDAYEQAAGPAVRFAADARGPNVPAFALLLAPMCPEAPTVVQIVAHRPGETGAEFHARVVELEALALATERGQELCEMEVLFLNCLPPIKWRELQQTRYMLHWRLTYGRDVMHRIAACGALARLHGLTYEDQRQC